MEEKDTQGSGDQEFDAGASQARAEAELTPERSSERPFNPVEWMQHVQEMAARDIKTPGKFDLTYNAVLSNVRGMPESHRYEAALLGIGAVLGQSDKLSMDARLHAKDTLSALITDPVKKRQILDLKE